MLEDILQLLLSRGGGGGGAFYIESFENVNLDWAHCGPR